MTALRKKNKRDAFGAVPLPRHFGEIDVNAPFDPERYYTALRSVGVNPMAVRQPDGRIDYRMNLLNWKKLSRVKRRRLDAAEQWAEKRDAKCAKRVSYAKAAVLKSPVDGIAYLGRGASF